jgi:predicted ATP-grasp superfamily ATP-dependent carboligase
MTRVLVYEHLSGGGVVDDDPAATARLMPAGLAMRDAIAADLLRSGDCDVTVASCRDATPVPAGATAVAAEPGETPQAFVARLAGQHDLAWVVAPETGGCLGEFARIVGPARWLGCDIGAIELASRKGTTLGRLAASGVATPPDLARDGAAQGWVVKPDDGAGAVATRRHADHAAAAADLDARRRDGAPGWMEPWVDGDPLSVSLLCRADGAELLSVNRQRIEVGAGGEITYLGVDIDVLPPADPRRAALAMLAGRVASAIAGLRGFVGIDLVWHPQRGPVVIEVNPRVTCAYVGLPERLGRCLAAEVLAARREEMVHA